MTYNVASDGSQQRIELLCRALAVLKHVLILDDRPGGAIAAGRRYHRGQRPLWQPTLGVVLLVGSVGAESKVA